MARLITKKSTVAAKVPLAADLEIGELAVNTADAKLYTKHNDGNVVGIKAEPLAHTHAVANVTGLQTALDAKAPISHTHDASAIVSGTIADARLPNRLREVAASISDWNDAQSNGWYMAFNAANAPVPSAWFLGSAENHGAAGWCTQIVHSFSTDSGVDTGTYRRERNSGVWIAWQRVRLTEAEQAAVTQAWWDSTVIPLSKVTGLQTALDAKVAKSGDTMTGALTLASEAIPLTANNLPTLRPSMLLDFSNSRSVDPRVTFTRASTATRTNEKGLIESVATNVPRIDFDPVSGACNGLLIEEARTNLLTYSEQFDNAAWVKYSAGVATNTIVAPDGTLTADKLVELTANAEHFIEHSVSPSAGTYTFSVYAKSGEYQLLVLRPVHVGSDQWATTAIVFTLTGDGVVSGSVPAYAAASIRSIGNGWYRCAVTVNITGAITSLRHRVQLTKTGTVGSYTGDGTSGIYIWGAQVEAGSFPTSYIPTTTAAATRAADVASMSGANFSSWYRASEGAFFASFRRAALVAGRILTLSDGTADNRISLSLSVSGASLRADLEVVVAGVSQVSTTTSPLEAVGSRIGVAFAYKANDFAISVNGAAVVTDTSGTVPTVNRMHIGTNATGSSDCHSGPIERLVYLPIRASNSELQALTAP